jgi:hypothetical protein
MDDLRFTTSLYDRQQGLEEFKTLGYPVREDMLSCPLWVFQHMATGPELFPCGGRTVVALDLEIIGVTDFKIQRFTLRADGFLLPVSWLTFCSRHDAYCAHHYSDGTWIGFVSPIVLNDTILRAPFQACHYFRGYLAGTLPDTALPTGVYNMSAHLTLEGESGHVYECPMTLNREHPAGTSSFYC